MATLTIGSKEYTARCDFSFDRTANEKYTSKEEDKAGGTLNIYMGLLNEDAFMLSAFGIALFLILKGVNRLQSKSKMQL